MIKVRAFDIMTNNFIKRVLMLKIGIIMSNYLNLH